MTAFLWTEDSERRAAARQTAPDSRTSGDGNCLSGAAQPPTLLRSVLRLVQVFAWGRRVGGRNVAVPDPAAPAGEPTTVHPWRSLPARTSVPQWTAASGPGASPGTAHEHHT